MLNFIIQNLKCLRYTTITRFDKIIIYPAQYFSTINEEYHKGEFTGWAVSHRFRSLNGAGSMTIPGEMIFFCDEEFTTCGGYETDKFEDFVKNLNAVDEATSDEDVIDYFKENNFLL